MLCLLTRVRYYRRRNIFFVVEPLTKCVRALLAVQPCRLMSLRSRVERGWRWLVSCRSRRGYPGVFPNNTALPARATMVRDPDQHVFIGYRAHGEATAGRKRAPPPCGAQTPATPPAEGQTIGTQPHRSPAQRVRRHTGLCRVCLSPRVRTPPTDRRCARRSATSSSKHLFSACARFLRH